MTAPDRQPLEDLPRDVAHVWYTVTERVDDEALARYRSWMTAEEIAREERYYFEKDRRQHRVARALIRSMLSRYTGEPLEAWQFATNDHGRPDVVAPEAWRDLRFNVSHTTGLVAIILNWETESGVDVEWRARMSGSVELADRFFSPDEVADLRRVELARQRDVFFDYWTLKEAYIKARGMGLALPLDQFSFVLREQCPIGIRFDPRLADDPARWHFERHEPTPTHTLSLALAHRGTGPPRVVVREVVP